MTELIELATRWRNEGADLRARYNDETKARLCEVHADELERAIHDAEQATLTLAQASHLSGYSIDHLGRMVREGKVPNAGRKGSPRIRVRDLPKRPGLPEPVPQLQLVGSSKEQIARSVLSHRGG